MWPVKRIVCAIMLGILIAPVFSIIPFTAGMAITSFAMSIVMGITALSIYVFTGEIQEDVISLGVNLLLMSGIIFIIIRLCIYFGWVLVPLHG